MAFYFDPDVTEEDITRRVRERRDYHYTNYSLVFFDFDSAHDVDPTSSPAWAQFCAGFKAIGCSSIYCGRDLERPQRIVALLEWQDCKASPEDLDLASSWAPLVPLLASQPQKWHILLNVRGFEIPPSDLYEFVIVAGVTKDAGARLAETLDLVSNLSRPAVAHDQTPNLVSCARGLTFRRAPGEEAATDVATLWAWRDHAKREAYLDPTCTTLGGASLYEDHVASQLRALEAQGATITRCLSDLRFWYPRPDKTESRRGWKKCLPPLGRFSGDATSR